MSLCPVCGYELDFTPWENDEQPERSCPSCGIYFGYDDLIAAQRRAIYAAWRNRWISDGKRWWGNPPQPADYDPDAQLRRLKGD